MIDNNKAPGAPLKKRMTPARADAALRRLPKSVREFLLYEACADFHLGSVVKKVRLAGEQATLTAMRDGQRKLTLAAYGAEHPGCEVSLSATQGARL